MTMKVDTIPGPLGGTHLYQAVYDLIYGKIRAKELPDGLSLKEGSLANILSVSRAPTQRALKILCQNGLIRQAEGQGYIVGSSDNVLRFDARQLSAALDQVPDQDVERRMAWGRIYSSVKKEITACLPFGTYRVMEAEVGREFSVSRTVVREVLSRLMDRRIIEKNRKSHWVAGPLTAHNIRESFEMRQILEPKALARVAPSLDQAVLSEMLDRVVGLGKTFDTATPEQFDVIEDDLHHRLLAGLTNDRMRTSIARNQLPVIVPKLFRRHFGVRSDFVIIERHRLILDQLLNGSVDVACAAFEVHLKKCEEATLAKLRVLSVLPDPVTAPYLVQTH